MTESTCPKCLEFFPSDLLTDMAINASYVRVCPICALRLRNGMHDLPLSTPFTGQLSHAMFVQAVEHLGASAPKWAKQIAKKAEATK